MEPQNRLQDIPAELMERYCANELALHDMAVLETFLRDNPDCRDELESLKMLVGMKSLPALSRRQKSEFADSILADQPISRDTRATENRWIRAGWMTVASLCVLVAFVAVPYFKGPKRSEFGIVRSAGYTTGTGQRAKVQLSDGSEAVLNAGTILRFAEYDNGTREIELHGEALFTVVSSQEKPFIVRARGRVVRVLGTSFLVRSYSTDSSVKVTVATGRVAFGDAVLAPGDMGWYKGNKVEVSHNTNISSALAWTDGELVFKSVPLNDVIPELERWYGIKVLVSDKRLLEELITTSLKTESVSEVINLLASALDATPKRDGMRVTFSPR